MNIATAIRERLLDLAPLTALVSTRVYVDELPQKPTLPAVRVQRISDVREMHLRGRSVSVARVQVDSVALGKASADAVDTAVDGDGRGSSATGLLGWFGALGGSPAVIDVLSILPIDARDTVERVDEHFEYMVSREYRVTWREAA